MFNTRKSDQVPNSPNTIGRILVALIAVYCIVNLYYSGKTLLVILGCIVMFGIWWVYDRFFSKTRNNELAKYQKALKKQKKKSPSGTPDRGKVIYLHHHKRK